MTLFKPYFLPPIFHFFNVLSCNHSLMRGTSPLAHDDIRHITYNYLHALNSGVGSTSGHDAFRSTRNDADHEVDHLKAAMSDKRTNITFGSYPHSNSTTYAQSTQDTLFSSSGISGPQHDIYQEGGIRSTSGRKVPGNERQENLREVLELIRDFYNKNEQLYGSVEDDWKRHLAQFTSLCNGYGSDDHTKLPQFEYSLRPAI